MNRPGRTTAVAHPNIALIKYWGNLDPVQRIPSNGSISMTLSGLETRTSVAFRADLSSDRVTIGGQPADPDTSARVAFVLDRVRSLTRSSSRAEVESANSFPTSSGIASSASGFAALARAAAAAAGLDLDATVLSRLARLGSGSACRSVYGGFVEWIAGSDDETSYAVPIAPPDHWDLRDVVAIVSRTTKEVGSSEGHRRADTSPLQAARVRQAPLRLEACRRALLHRDFPRLAEVIEQDSDLMHAVMRSSTPALDYSTPTTAALRNAVPSWRDQGVAAAYTQDAGPHLHVICTEEHAAEVIRRVTAFPGVIDVLVAGPGGAPQIVEGDKSG